MITGSAGCQEKHDPWLPMPGITAFRSADYGFTRMKAHNSSHMEIAQISDDKVLRMVLVYSAVRNVFNNMCEVLYKYYINRVCLSYVCVP